MSPRQARRERREAERKARKAELKRAKAAAASALNPPTMANIANPELEQEFSPEFLAHARSIRERIERRVAGERSSATPLTSHPVDSSASPTQSRERQRPVSELGFVSQNVCTPSRAEINRANAQYSTDPPDPRWQIGFVS